MKQHMIRRTANSLDNMGKKIQGLPDVHMVNMVLPLSNKEKDKLRNVIAFLKSNPEYVSNLLSVVVLTVSQYQGTPGGSACSQCKCRLYLTFIN